MSQTTGGDLADAIVGDLFTHPSLAVAWGCLPTAQRVELRNRWKQLIDQKVDQTVYEKVEEDKRWGNEPPRFGPGDA